MVCGPDGTTGDGTVELVCNAAALACWLVAWSVVIAPSILVTLVARPTICFNTSSIFSDWVFSFSPWSGVSLSPPAIVALLLRRGLDGSVASAKNCCS